MSQIGRVGCERSGHIGGGWGGSVMKDADQLHFGKRGMQRSLELDGC